VNATEAQTSGAAKFGPELIAEFGRVVAQDELSPKQILSRAAELLLGVLRAPVGYFGTVGPEKNQLHVRFVGAEAAMPKTLEVSVNDRLFGEPTPKHEPTVIVLARDSDSAVERNLVEKGHSLLVKLLIHDRHVLVGAIGGLLPEIRELETEEWAYLDILSRMIGMKQEIAELEDGAIGRVTTKQPRLPVEGGTPKVGRERRWHPRNRFRFIQYIAPLRDSVRPNLKDFFPVECRDISESGLAFLLQKAPDFDKLLIAFGRPPVLVHCLAEVVRTERVRTDRGPRTLVGCRFLKRVAF